MVMTLRKRAAPPRRSPSPSSSSSLSSDTETRSKKQKQKQKPKPKPKRNAPQYISSSDSDSDLDSGSGSGSDGENGYEKFREQRIRENKERMEKLGIFSLCSQFNVAKKNSKNVPVKKKAYTPFFPRRRNRDYDSRRSDRLKDVRGGKYLENERTLREMGISIPDGWKTEVYTEEDEKLLGNCETEWKLNVDGFGEDGERLYDPVNGTSCHQCRQKTIRKHTYCPKCRSPQGQICGDCLYTRYGENVLEASENPDWKCPACREICNCSRCRRTKGWPPVNILYEKVTEAGYKSVAHYLILSRGAGAFTKESEEGTDVIDLTKGGAQAPAGHDGSDAEWSKSDEDDDDEDDDDDDDDDDSKTQKHFDGTDPSAEAVVTAESNEGLNEPTVSGNSVR